MVWHKCLSYTLEIDSDNISFSLSMKGADGVNCRLQPRTASEDKELVKKVLRVIANAWAGTDIEFKCESNKLVDMRSS